MVRRSHIVLFLFLCLFVDSSRAQEIIYETRDIAVGLNNPWEIRYSNNGWIYFTERPGRFSKVNPETGERKELLNAIDCKLWWEAGMLGFDFHPSFPDSPFIYIAYVREEVPEPRLELYKYRYTGDSLIDRARVFGPMRAGYMHNGCRVVIHDQKIFLSLGELNEKDSAQSLTNPHGKILRLNLDGSIPTDNPIAGSAIWSIGHRNPQGLEFSPNGLLYSSEHGDATDDEINIIEKGGNYGWPMIAGYCDSDLEREECSEEIVTPLMTWTPTVAVGDIGLYLHDSCKEWKNSLLVTTLKDASIHQLKLDSTGKKVIHTRRIPVVLSGLEQVRAGRLRSICFSPTGRIFLSTAKGSGIEDSTDRIFELWRTGVHPYYVDLKTPEESQSVNAEQVRLTWKPIAGDSKFQVELSKTAEFNEGDIVMSDTTSDSVLVVPSLPVDSWFFWRVREITSNGPWSFYRGFATVTSSVERDDLNKQGMSFTRSLGKQYIQIASHRQNADLLIFDILGSEVMRMAIGANDTDTEIELAGLNAGYYMAVLRTAKSITSTPIIIY